MSTRAHYLIKTRGHSPLRSTREFVEAGELMPNYPNAIRRTVDLGDKTLRGAKPRDIPVEQPSTDLVINLNYAKACANT